MNNWAIQQIQQTPGETNELIVVTTNNPCHLTLSWSYNQPLRHKTTRIERGLSIPWGAYFCFDPHGSVEQAEAGDTLIHTCDVTSWPHCQTRWFLFTGTVVAVASPSVSAIYEKHHRARFTETFIAIKDNYLNNFFLNRFTNFGSSTLVSVRNYLGQGAEHVTLLAFSVSSLLNKTLLSATLRLYLLAIPGSGEVNTVFKLLHNDWSELESSFMRKSSGIPWNNIAFSATDFTTTNNVSSVVPAAGYIDFNILPLVLDSLASFINLNLAIMGVLPVLSSQTYRSREHADPATRPQVIAIYDQ